MARLLALSYEQYLRRPSHFNNLANHFKNRLVFIDVSGRDAPLIHNTPEGLRIFDSRRALLSQFKPQSLNLLIGRTHSKYNKWLIDSKPNNSNFIDVDELVTLFPEIVPLSFERGVNQHNLKQLRAGIKHRLPNINTESKSPFKIDLIAITSNIGIHNWDESLQVIMDYHSNEDGTIGELHHKAGRDPNKAISIHFPYFSQSPKGLLGAEHFVNALQTIYKLVYKRKVANLVPHTLQQLVTFVSNEMGIDKSCVVLDSELINKDFRQSHGKTKHQNSRELQSISIRDNIQQTIRETLV